MNKVSLYIAKRYNTYTLLISIALISILGILAASLIYMINSSFSILRILVYGEVLITPSDASVLYLFSGIFILILLSAVYLFFKRTLKKTKPSRKVLIAFLISVLFVIPEVLIRIFGVEISVFLQFIILILTSTGLLSLLSGLLSFLLSRRKITAVNIITAIAVFAITIATTALFIILSVFSGLEKMNLKLFTNVNPDLKISAAKGKLLNNIDEITAKLDKDNGIAAYSKVIEEKVSIEFDNKQDIAYIKGVDENYKNVVKIDTAVVYGDYFDFKNQYEILASDGVARRLQMYIDHQHTSRLRMPKPGTGLIKTEEDAFNTAVASPVGVFILNDQYDKYIFSPIGLTRTLLMLPNNSAYSIELKLKPNLQPATYKQILKKELGNTVVVQTRQDLDATFLKVMNVENMITYLIFTLVIVISSFNLAGAIIIIIIDKKEQIKTIWSFGMQLKHIKQIFFQTGIFITLFSVLIGLIMGTIIGMLQKSFRLVMANQLVPFPFEFTWINYIIVFSTVVFIGGTVAWLVSRKMPV